jgi:hypothetical protein
MSMNDIGAVSSRFVRLGLTSIAFLATMMLAQAAPPQTLALDVKEGKLAGPGAEVIRAS